jgi:hypothetical protein
MIAPREMFQKRIDSMMERTPPEKRDDLKLAIDGIFTMIANAAELQTSKEALGKHVGPLLKKLEENYVPKEPPKPERTLGEKIRILEAVGVIDADLLPQILKYKAVGIERVVSSAVRRVEREGQEGSSPTPRVDAYTELHGFIFEQKRIDLAAAWGRSVAERRTPDPLRVWVNYTGLRDSAQTLFKRASIDNDVPIIPGWIWEMKWYPRKDYGTSEENINQILKYQAAVGGKIFDYATIEVFGNMSPDFVAGIRYERNLVPWGQSFSGVDILYVTPDGGSLSIKRPEELAGRKSLAVPSPDTKLFERALRDRNYEVFSGRIVREEDIYGPLQLEIQAALRSGTVDPLLITDVAVFKEYERLCREKRQRMIGP